MACPPCGRLHLVAVLLLFPGTAWAQQPFRTIIHPGPSPILVAADRLSVSKKRGLLIGSGNVLVKQIDEHDLYCSRVVVRWRRPLTAHNKNVVDYLACEP